MAGEMTSNNLSSTMKIHILPAHEKGAEIPKSIEKEVSKDHYCKAPEHLNFFSYIQRGQSSQQNQPLEALKRVNEQLKTAKKPELILEKDSHNWGGHNVPPGHVGLLLEGENPLVVPQNGRIWNYFSPTRSWKGHQPYDNIHFQGINSYTLNNNVAAVVVDPNGTNFVVQNSAGYVSYDIAGRYTHLGTVQTNHQSNPVKDPYTKDVLGYRAQVVNPTSNTVAAEFLFIPTNHVAVLDRFDTLEMLPAGPHAITDSQVSFRAFFTKGDVNITTPMVDVMTLDQVPARMAVNVNMALEEPLKLAGHGFHTPWDAIQVKVQQHVASVVSSLEYKQFLGQVTLGDKSTTRSAIPAPHETFNEAVQRNVVAKLTADAAYYGIRLNGVVVAKHELSGDTHATMQRMADNAMNVAQQKQIVEQENANLQAAAKGKQLVTNVENEQIIARSAAEKTAAINRAEAEAQASIKAAEGFAQALELRTAAQAKALKELAAVDAEISNTHAQRMELARNAVEQLTAAGNRATIIPYTLGPAAAADAASLLTMQTVQSNLK